MRGKLNISWLWRSREPARSPPDPDYPRGMVVDLTKGAAMHCRAILQYPAPGVGTWIIRCETCGWQGAVTAAGRTDDPTSVVIPCKPDA